MSEIFICLTLDVFDMSMFVKTKYPNVWYIESFVQDGTLAKFAHCLHLPMRAFAASHGGHEGVLEGK